jgi:GxxExxY protein
MSKVPEHVDAFAKRIIGCGINVHKEYGPGLLESVYSECMVLELRREGLKVETNRRVPLTYRGEVIHQRLELDMLVEDSIVIELKSVERLHPVHQAQVITYLKLTGHPLGLLMNFNATTFMAGFKRLEHPDLYEPKRGDDPEQPSKPRKRLMTF